MVQAGLLAIGLGPPPRSEDCHKCGVASSTRNRALGIMPFPQRSLFVVADQAAYAGTQLNVTECPEMEECEPYLGLNRPLRRGRPEVCPSELHLCGLERLACAHLPRLENRCLEPACAARALRASSGHSATQQQVRLRL